MASVDIKDAYLPVCVIAIQPVHGQLWCWLQIWGCLGHCGVPEQCASQGAISTAVDIKCPTDSTGPGKVQLGTEVSEDSTGCNTTSGVFSPQRGTGKSTAFAGQTWAPFLLGGILKVSRELGEMRATFDVVSYDRFLSRALQQNSTVSYSS